MLKSCRYAADPENPDSGPFRVFLSFLQGAILFSSIWFLCYFPGLLINLADPEVFQCPSMLNKSYNEAFCDASSTTDAYHFCIFKMLQQCCYYGLMLSLMIGFVPFVVVGLVILYRRRKLYTHWKGSMWKTLSFILLYSDENPDGLFLRVHYGEEDEIDETKFSKRRCCGYVAKYVFWHNLMIVFSLLALTVVIILYILYVSIPMGYSINIMIPSLGSGCFSFLANTTHSECSSDTICRRVCSRDGMITTLLLFPLTVVVFLICNMIWSCRKAFKTPEEIEILKRELEPLVQH